MSATCYFASGKNADLSGSTYIPCNTTAVAEGGHSACCAPDDMCFTNGLCKAGSDDQYNWNWRVGCTDPTFNDPACPSYCQGIGELLHTAEEIMTTTKLNVKIPIMAHTWSSNVLIMKAGVVQLVTLTGSLETTISPAAAMTT